MVEVIKLTGSNEQSAISKTAKAVIEGKVILYPTDTVYGIGGDATSNAVVAKIYKIKHRMQAKPLSVAFSNYEGIETYCQVNARQQETLKRFLPGPYTFILKIKKLIAATPGDKIGVRIPENYFIRRVIEQSHKPLITTSANLSGEKDAFEFEDVDRQVLDACDLAIHAGSTRYNQPSTVVDLVNGKLLRKGAGKWKETDD